MGVFSNSKIVGEIDACGRPFRWLRSTCAQSCVADSDPSGHVENYAPKIDLRLRLALHHISYLFNQ